MLFNSRICTPTIEFLFFYFVQKTEFRTEYHGNTAGFFLLICKIFRHGIFNQKIENATSRDFFSLRCYTSICSKISDHLGTPETIPALEIIWYNNNSFNLGTLLTSFKRFLLIKSFKVNYFRVCPFFNFYRSRASRF